MTDSEIVLTRDTSSGRIHKRVLLDSGALATLEACNLDDAGAYEIVAEADLTETAPETYCARCFGDKT